MQTNEHVKHLTDDLSEGGVLEVPVGEKSRPRVEAYLAGELAEHAKPRMAATVMLMREPQDGGSGLEAFMMQRAATMAFVPDAVVFPGGGMDPQDREDPAPWAGPSPAQWAELIGCDCQTARAIVTTAVRELFEECGVLLASNTAGGAPCAFHGVHWVQERARLAAHELSFATFLREHGLVLRSDLLALRAHWITPEHEPRRYDTYFFTAHLPEGQEADGKSSEAVVAGWVSPAGILERYRKGEVHLVPPTIANLSVLAHVRTAGELFELPPAEQVMLRPVRKGDGSLVLRGVLA